MPLLIPSFLKDCTIFFVSITFPYFNTHSYTSAIHWRFILLHSVISCLPSAIPLDYSSRILLLNGVLMLSSSCCNWEFRPPSVTVNGVFISLVSFLFLFYVACPVSTERIQYKKCLFVAGTTLFPPIV